MNRIILGVILDKYWINISKNIHVKNVSLINLEYHLYFHLVPNDRLHKYLNSYRECGYGPCWSIPGYLTICDRLNNDNKHYIDNFMSFTARNIVNVLPKRYVYSSGLNCLEGYK